jgi:hypothetical protein
MNLLAFLDSCGHMVGARALPGRLEKLREEKPASLILGQGPDGRYKTLLPFPDLQAAYGMGAHAAPLECH